MPPAGHPGDVMASTRKPTCAGEACAARRAGGDAGGGRAWGDMTIPVLQPGDAGGCEVRELSAAWGGQAVAYITGGVRAAGEA